MDKSTDSSSGNRAGGGGGGGDAPPQTRGLGCGPAAASASSTAVVALPLGAPLPLAARAAATLLNLNISTTTGGNFGVTVDPHISVENLKKIVAKKLKVAKDRICLLHREKELQDGTLKDNNLMDGSKIILIPNVETGLLAQRPENTVMQALESLNDSQVNDFLSGKTPLNLSMRLGDHMMLIQLQLSTVNPANIASSLNGGTSCSSSASSSARARLSQRSSRSNSSTVAAGTAAHSHHHHHHHHHHASNVAGAVSTSAAATQLSKQDVVDAASAAITCQRSSRAASSSSASTVQSSDLSSFLSKRDYESLQNIVKSIAMAQPARLTVPAQQLPQRLTNPTTTSAAAAKPTATAAGFHAPSEAGTLLEQSPIKSLSNLVSSRIKSIPIVNGGGGSSSGSTSASVLTSSEVMAASSAVSVAAAAASCQDPIAAKLTSCLCTRLNSASSAATNAASTARNCIESACLSRQDVAKCSGQPRTAMLTSTPTKSSSSMAVVASPASAAASAAALLHKTANNPITRASSKHRHHHHHHHHHHHYHHHSSSSSTGSGSGNISASSASSSSSSSSSASSSASLRNHKPLPASPRCVSVASNSSCNDSGFASNDSTLASTTAPNGSRALLSPITPVRSSSSSSSSLSSPATSSAGSSPVPDSDDSSVVAASDTRTLAEASRNLTQTLRKLSKEVFTNKIDLSGSGGDADTPRKNGSGAVIESMKNHGKGIYSGTFSGTLNPALQDRYGRPKRDISTVIHILNDLLSATPQYSRGARISFEAPSSSSAASAANGSSAANISSRSKQIASKHQHHHSCLKCIKAQSHSHAHTHVHASSGSSSSSACAYGECNGHYVSKTAAKASYACCQDLSAGGTTSNGAGSAETNTNDRKVCSCRYRIVDESGEREREHTCQKCLITMENLKTKSKLDQLRLVMQQRKQKREARKLKGAPYAPYGARVVSATTTAAVAPLSAAAVAANTAQPAQLAAAAASSTSPTTQAAPSEVSPNHIAEEVDTAA